MKVLWLLVALIVSPTNGAAFYGNEGPATLSIRFSGGDLGDELAQSFQALQHGVTGVAVFLAANSPSDSLTISLRKDSPSTLPVLASASTPIVTPGSWARADFSPADSTVTAGVTYYIVVQANNDPVNAHLAANLGQYVNGNASFGTECGANVFCANATTDFLFRIYYPTPVFNIAYDSNTLTRGSTNVGQANGTLFQNQYWVPTNDPAVYETHAFNITNPGTQTLNVNVLPISSTRSQDWSIVGQTTLNILPGGTAPIFIRFDPSAPVPTIPLVSSAVINMTTSDPDPDTPYFTFTVLGTAIGVVPQAPHNISAYPGPSQQVIVYFNLLTTADELGGAASIMQYNVFGTPAGSAMGLTSPIAVSGLTNGVPHTFTVRAMNSVGLGAASNVSVVVIPRTVPDQVVTVTLSVASGQISLAITPPGDGGAPISSFTCTAKQGATILASKSGNSPITFVQADGLVRGQMYEFVCNATNAAGTGPQSTATASTLFASAPDAITTLTPSAGDAIISLAITSPNTGGSAITQYTCAARQGATTIVVKESAGVSPIDFTLADGLIKGQMYNFACNSTNIRGTSAESAASAGSLFASVPDQMTGITTTPTSGQISVNFPAGGDGGSAITGYNCSALATSASKSGATGPFVFLQADGLTLGEYVQFVCHAINDRGYGMQSTPTATVLFARVPDAPTVSVLVGDTQAIVTITNGAYHGGSAITSYNVTAVGPLNTRAQDGTTNTITLTGLTNNVTYTFSAVAINARGQSAASVGVQATVGSAPSVPLAVSAVSELPGQAIVSFNPPTSDGGYPILFYTITSTPGSISVNTSTVSPVTITGLTNGQSYTFRVTATNIRGVSVASTASNAIIPVGGPSGTRIFVRLNTQGCTDMSDVGRTKLAMGIATDIATALDAPMDQIKVIVTIINETCHAVVDLKATDPTIAVQLRTNFINQLGLDDSRLKRGLFARDLGQIAGTQALVNLVRCPDGTLEESTVNCRDSNSGDTTWAAILGGGIIIMLLILAIGCWCAKRADQSDAVRAADKRYKAELEAQAAGASPAP